MTSAEFLAGRIEALAEIAGIERDVEVFVQQTGTRHANDMQELHERLQEVVRHIAGRSPIGPLRQRRAQRCIE